MRSAGLPPVQSYARLPLARLPDLGPLRVNPGIRAQLDGGLIWLTWSDVQPEVICQLRSIPEIVFYLPAGLGRLRREGDILAEVAVPSNPWGPLSQLLQVELPSAAIARSSVPRTGLSLVASVEPRPVGAILAAFSNWHDWAIKAPQFRLQSLRFAVNSQGETLIVGALLPSIPGRTFYNMEGLLIPAGWQLTPIQDAAVIRKRMLLKPGDIALMSPFEPQCKTVLPVVTVIPQEHFVAASRAAVRATLQGLTP